LWRIRNRKDVALRSLLMSLTWRTSSLPLKQQLESDLYAARAALVEQSNSKPPLDALAISCERPKELPAVSRLFPKRPASQEEHPAFRVVWGEEEEGTRLGRCRRL
jgi:hypothetical protein